MKLGFAVFLLILSSSIAFAAPSSSTRINVNLPPYCSDRDGKNFLTFDYVHSDKVKFFFDSCQAPGAGQSTNKFKSFLNRVTKFLRLQSSPQQSANPLTDGDHMGAYQTILNEAVCDGKRATTLKHDCIDEKMSCVFGRCEAIGCETIPSMNQVRYKGFTVNARGYLKDAAELAKTMASCRNDVTLITYGCSKVPDGEYAVSTNLVEGLTFVANAGQDFLAMGQRTCHGTQTLLDYGIGEVTVSGCVNKEKLIDALDDIPGTGSAISRIRQAPDFAYCAEDPPSNPPGSEHGGSSSGAGGSSGGGNTDSGEGSGRGSETGNNGGDVAVQFSCMPLAGNEEGNWCAPPTNGVKLANPQGQTVSGAIYCNSCDENDMMYQCRCVFNAEANIALQECRIVNCKSGNSICDANLNRCANCTDSFNNWCGGN